MGLCNVVHTAVSMGMTRADGKSLLAWDGAYKDKSGKIQYSQPPADDLPTFTLGAVNVSPMSMAAAYATPASGGVYCKPIVLTKVINAAGQSLPVPSAGCHRVMSTDVAAAVNYILQGVLTSGTAAGMGLANYQAAGKTGTSNVQSGNGTPFAAFAGYTTEPGRLRLGVQPDLAGQVHDDRLQRLLPTTNPAGRPCSAPARCSAPTPRRPPGT